MEKFVGLVRVSTEKQEESGLGLLAGHADIQAYVAQVDGELLDVLQEVESGGHDAIVHRPTLLHALALCMRHKAILLIPKIDRLVRSTEVHTDIKRSGVAIRCCDMPEANEFTLDILVAVAAWERREISKRTKKALAAYKVEGRVGKKFLAKFGGVVPDDVLEARRGKLGTHLPNNKLTHEARQRGRSKANESQARKAQSHYSEIATKLQALRKSGLSLQACADQLNALGITTRNGCLWTSVQVSRVLSRS
jgi:DNA invertase Pin-like site-specific DNA recombinase